MSQQEVIAAVAALKASTNALFTAMNTPVSSLRVFATQAAASAEAARLDALRAEAAAEGGGGPGPVASIAPTNVTLALKVGVAVNTALGIVSNGVPTGVSSGVAPAGTAFVLLGQVLRIQGTPTTQAAQSVVPIGVNTSGGPVTFTLTSTVAAADAPSDPDGQEAIDYGAAVAAAGGALTSDQRTAHSEFVAGAKTAGLWTRLLEVGTFSGGTVASAAVKLKAMNSNPSIMTGFVQGDLTAKGLRNTANKWVNTRTTPAMLPNTGLAGMGMYVTEEVTTDNFGFMMGTTADEAPNIAMRWYGAGDRRMEFMMGGDGATSIQSLKLRNAIPVGLIHMERASLGEIRSYVGGTVTGIRSDSNSVYATSTDQIAIFAGSDGSQPFQATVGMYFITNGTFTAADALALAKLCNRLMADLGRIAPVQRNRNIYLTSGQSLSIGAEGAPALSVAQPYLNLGIDSLRLGGNPYDQGDGWLTAGNSGATIGALTPLVEQSTETHMSGACNTVSKLTRDAGGGSANDAIALNTGVGGVGYSDLKKGSNAYANGLFGVTRILEEDGPASVFAVGANDVPAVDIVHGEADAASQAYQQNIRQWQRDYNADLDALLGVSKIRPMFASQPSAWTSPANGNLASAISPFAILAEHRAYPARSPMVCPKYFLQHAPDGQHLIGASYRRLGEYYGKARFQHLVQGTQWEPLQPLSITRNGAVIDVVMKGCVGNLVLDNTNVTDPGNGTFGFEYTDSAVPAANRYTSIASVAVLTQSPPTLRITLAANPDTAGTTNRMLGYATYAPVGALGGPTTGPRGCVRDSDARTGPSGVALWNWMPHCRMAVPIRNGAAPGLVAQLNFEGTQGATALANSASGSALTFSVRGPSSLYANSEFFHGATNGTRALRYGTNSYGDGGAESDQTVVLDGDFYIGGHFTRTDYGTLFAVGADTEAAGMISVELNEERVQIATRGAEGGALVGSAAAFAAYPAQTPKYSCIIRKADLLYLGFEMTPGQVELVAGPIDFPRSVVGKVYVMQSPTGFGLRNDDSAADNFKLSIGTLPFSTFPFAVPTT